jgi:cell division protein FtsZ
MSVNLGIPDEEVDLKPRITVVGVGGAGGNAVSNMVRSGLSGCEFVVCNTDAQAMRNSLAERRIQLGVGVTRGLGAGSRPEIGRIAAEEALEEIMKELEGSNMVFITAGMGGGTGTGAAPVIARAAREAGILTVGVVTKPFHFEGTHRMRLAESGILELQKFVDTLIVIPNQNLFRVANERTTFADAFKMADDVLASGVRGVTDLMIMPGLINLDFADIRAVMSEMGKAMMGTGEAEGDRRSIDAAEAAISNPLLEDVSMKGARGVLINVTGGLDMTLFEVDEAANRIREEVDPDANIIFGSTFDDKLAGRMRISVVATGIDLEGVREPKPTIALVSDRSQQPAAKPAIPAPKPEPAAAPAMAAEPAAAPAAAAITVEPDPPQVKAVEQAAIEKGGFFPARPLETPFVRPAVTVAAAPPAPPPPPEPPKRARTPSLFERVKTGRLMMRDNPPAPRVAPAGPQQPRLGGLDPADRIAPAERDSDELDIPAFLRRQAN